MTKIEINSKIDEVANQIDIAMKRALESAALFVQGEAVIKVPVDQGRLKQSITHWTYKDFAIVGTNVEYAPYVEFGTGIYSETGIGRKKPWGYIYEGKKFRQGFHWTWGQRPQPYLRPALNDNTSKVLGIISSELKKATEK